MVTNTQNSLNAECEICRGCHFLHPVVNGKTDYSRLVPCECVEKEWARKKQEALQKYCELPPMADGLTFESYKPYNENLKMAYKVAREFADKPNELTWLVFTGGNDTGKTHLAISICREWLKAGVASKYAFVPLLLDELRVGFGEKGDSSYNSRFKTLCEIPLLVLDDLGAESSTAWVQEKLETIIDYRYMNKLSLIVTTNKTISELTPRISSRLMRHPNSTVVHITAKEYTIEKVRLEQ